MSLNDANSTGFRAIFSSFAVTAALACASTSSAALSPYLLLTGSKQGQIKGPCTEKGREGCIVVSGVRATILPVDPKTGNVDPNVVSKFKANKTQDPFKMSFAKGDPALVAISLAQANKEPLKVNVQLWDNTAPSPQLVAQFVLPEAVVNALNTVHTTSGDYVEVSYVYRKIQWTYKHGNQQQQDAWSQ